MTPQPTGKEGPFVCKPYKPGGYFNRNFPWCVSSPTDFQVYSQFAPAQDFLEDKNRRILKWLKSPKGRAGLRRNGVIG